MKPKNTNELKYLIQGLIGMEPRCVQETLVSYTQEYIELYFVFELEEGVQISLFSFVNTAKPEHSYYRMRGKNIMYETDLFEAIQEAYQDNFRI